MREHECLPPDPAQEATGEDPGLCPNTLGRPGMMLTRAVLVGGALVALATCGRERWPAVATPSSHAAPEAPAALSRQARRLLAQHAQPGAVDCGEVQVGSDPRATDTCLSRAFATKRPAYGWFWTQTVGGVTGEGAVIMPKFQPIDRRVRAAITHYDSKACGSLGDCTGGFSTAGCYEPMASTIVGHAAFSCRRPPFRV
jgi:hypothetical protein